LAALQYTLMMGCQHDMASISDMQGSTKVRGC